MHYTRAGLVDNAILTLWPNSHRSQRAYGRRNTTHVKRHPQVRQILHNHRVLTYAFPLYLGLSGRWPSGAAFAAGYLVKHHRELGMSEMRERNHPPEQVPFYNYLHSCWEIVQRAVREGLNIREVLQGRIHGLMYSPPRKNWVCPASSARGSPEQT